MGDRGALGIVTAPVRVLVTGAAGQLGRDLVDVLRGELPAAGDPGWVGRLGLGRAREVVATDMDDLDLRERAGVADLWARSRPDVVVHCAAMTAVDRCEAAVEEAFAVNALATRNVAEACAETGAHLLAVSTDYVFAGDAGRPYAEGDVTDPRSVYGASKLAGEREALTLAPRAAVVRTAWVNGVHGVNVARTVLALVAADPGRELRFVADQRGCPTFTADLAPAIARLALDRRPGLFHVTNAGEATWHGFAREILACRGLDPDRVVPISTAELDPPRPAPRPADSRLAMVAWRVAGLPEPPRWQDALARMVAAVETGG